MFTTLTRGLSRCFGSAALLVCALPVLAALAPESAGRGSQPDMLDARVNFESSYKSAVAARPGSATTGLQRARQDVAAIKGAIDTKKKTMPGLQVRLSDITGGAEVVRNSRGALTSASGQSNENIVRGFLGQNGALYGLQCR